MLNTKPRGNSVSHLSSAAGIARLWMVRPTKEATLQFLHLSPPWTLPSWRPAWSCDPPGEGCSLAWYLVTTRCFDRLSPRVPAVVGQGLQGYTRLLGPASAPTPLSLTYPSEKQVISCPKPPTSKHSDLRLFHPCLRVASQLPCRPLALSSAGPAHFRHGAPTHSFLLNKECFVLLLALGVAGRLLSSSLE